MALADDTADWAAQRQAADLDVALGGVAILAAPNADLEARAVALAARETIARDKSVGIFFF